MKTKINGVKLFGIINMIIGTVPSLFLVFHFFLFPFYITMFILFTFFGWVTDEPFKSFLDYFLSTIVMRGFVIIIYIGTILLAWSGIWLLKKKPYAIRFSRVAILAVILGCTGFISYVVIDMVSYAGNGVIDYNALQIPAISLTAALLYYFIFSAYFSNRLKQGKIEGINGPLPRNKVVLMVKVLLGIIFGCMILQGFLLSAAWIYETIAAFFVRK